MANEMVRMIIGGNPVKMYRGYCKVCGKTFIGQSSTKKYCSDECRVKSIGGDEPCECKECGATFYKRTQSQQYCSKRCCNAARDRANREMGVGDKEKYALLSRFMEETKMMPTRENLMKPKPTPKAKPTTSPDGCVFVKVDSISGYWKKAII